MMKMFGKYKFCSFVMLIATIGIAISSCSGDDGDVKDERTDIDAYRATGTVDGHKYVDLGLSVSWATENVGAHSITDSGNDYFWADPTGKLTFEGLNSRVVPMPPINGTSLDVAAVKWGANWALPTSLEIIELSEKCTILRCRLNGKTGYKVCGPNGNSIFLPDVTTRYSFDIKPPYKENYSSDFQYMYSGDATKDNHGKTTLWCGFSIDETGYSFVNGHNVSTFAVRAVTHKGATGSLSGGTGGGGNGGNTSGGSTSTSEKPEIGLEDYTCYTTSITVKYRIYNQDKAKVTSAKGYYGTSSASKSVSASVSGSLITIRVTGLKKGTTYYVKCSATGKGGTTTSETTKLITDY